MKSQSTDKSRHIVLFAQEGEQLPDALVEALRDQAVTCGWVRASGVVSDVELRVYDHEIGELAAGRRIKGAVHVVSLEGSVGMHAGDVSVGLRAVIARETDRGIETIAGELTSARAIALEVFVTALDDLAIPRVFDAGAGVWLLGEERVGGTTPRLAPQPPRATSSREAPPSAWSDAIEASHDSPRPTTRPQSKNAVTNVAMPLRPVTRARAEEDTEAPEAGDLVQHFAFGPSEVVKSDGERLHLRVGKDGRIREIAVEMLRVLPLPPDEATGKRVWKLERKL